MTLAVETVGLVKRFGPTLAVDGVDLAVPPGQVLGLLGPNGAGKTTVVRMLATLPPARCRCSARWGLPGWLQAWVRVNPVTELTAASRGLMLGGPVATPAWHSVAWSLALTAVFAPLAVRRYRRIG